MTAREIKARLARRAPHVVAAARARYDATTEAKIRRHMRDDGCDPDAEMPADARYLVPVRLVRERMTPAELAGRLRVPVGTLRNRERNRFGIDPAMQALLLVLYREPGAALRASRHAAWGGCCGSGAAVYHRAGERAARACGRPVGRSGRRASIPTRSEPAAGDRPHRDGRKWCGAGPAKAAPGPFSQEEDRGRRGAPGDRQEERVQVLHDER